MAWHCSTSLCAYVCGRVCVCVRVRVCSILQWLGSVEDVRRQGRMPDLHKQATSTTWNNKMLLEDASLVRPFVHHSCTVSHMRMKALSKHVKQSPSDVGEELAGLPCGVQQAILQLHRMVYM